MPNNLPVALLVELFMPSQVYKDIERTLETDNPKDEKWTDRACEILESLTYNVEYNIDPRIWPPEVSDLQTEVIVDQSTMKKASEAIASIGQAWTDTQNQVSQELRNGLMGDLERVIAVLSSLGIDKIPSELESMPAEWMECVGKCGALPDFLDRAIASIEPVWMNWFLVNAPPPHQHGDIDLRQSLETISRRTMPGRGVKHPTEHASLWMDWCARSPQWGKLKTAPAIYLAHFIRDPQAPLCQDFDRLGFKFDIEKVDWHVAIAHALLLPVNGKLAAKDVEAFLVKHLTTLASTWPQWASQEHDLPTDKSYALLPRQLTTGNGLRAMLENIKEPALRTEMSVSIDQIALARATAPARARKSSRARL